MLVVRLDEHCFPSLRHTRRSSLAQALIVFSYFLFLSAVALLVFWALQIRYGDISDLDPDALLVKWFAPKKQLTSVKLETAETISASVASVSFERAITAGGLATVVVLAVIVNGGRSKVVTPLENPCFSASSLCAPAMPFRIR